MTNPDLSRQDIQSLFLHLMRSGIIRGVPTSVTDQELKLNLKSSCHVTEIKRRVVKENGVEYTPSTSVNLKFAGQILPRQVFLFYDSYEVLPIVPRVKTCFSCFRVGHIRKFCKSRPRCRLCGKDAHKEDEMCERQNLPPKYINCSGDHHVDKLPSLY